MFSSRSLVVKSVRAPAFRKVHAKRELAHDFFLTDAIETLNRDATIKYSLEGPIPEYK